MFEIKQTDVTGMTNKLLYNILEELKRLNTAEPVRPSREGVETPVQKPKVTCKRCGKKFEGHGEFLKHAKLCKKEMGVDGKTCTTSQDKRRR